MRLKIVYSKHIPFRGYKAITILFWMVVRKDKRDYLSWVDEKHKNIHFQQEIEMGFILFYLWYGIEWFIKFLCSWNQSRAYRSVSFEWEAYAHEYRVDYLQVRRRYEWIKYVFNLKPKK